MQRETAQHRRIRSRSTAHIKPRSSHLCLSRRLPPAPTLLALLRLHTSHLIRSHIRPCNFSTSSSWRDFVISTSASGPSRSLAGSWTHGAVITPPTPIYRAAQLGRKNTAVLKPWQASAKNHQRTRPHESCMEPTSGNQCRNAKSHHSCGSVSPPANQLWV